MKPAVSTLAAAALLASCGYVGPPLPPALDIPTRVTDLRAVEYGDNIRVEFTLPPLTTEGLPLTSVRSVELRAAVPGGTASTFDVPAVAPGPLGRLVPAREWIGQDVVLTVHATGPKGKASDWSNPVTVHVDTPLPRPVNLKAENAEQGVRLTWQGGSAHYRIFRAEGDQKPEQRAEIDSAEYLDTTIHFGMRYQYFVQAIAGPVQQSEVSEPATITPQDVFPPAVPRGISAVAGVNAIELAWERNTEPNFKGYDVYRSVDGAPFEKIASEITAPAYSDHQVETGKTYRYEVSAVDLSGLESERSAPQQVTAQ